MNHRISLDPLLLIKAYRQPLIALLIRRFACDATIAERIIDEFLAPPVVAHWKPQFDPAHESLRTFIQARAIEFAVRSQSVSAGMPGAMSDAVPGAVNGTRVEPDTQFEQEWIQGVLQIALDALRAESAATKRPQAFGIFERYDLREYRDHARPTYAALAREWNLPTTQVTNYLAWARRQFRHHVLETLGGLTGSETEFWHEVRTLLGDDPAGEGAPAPGTSVSPRL